MPPTTMLVISPVASTTCELSSVKFSWSRLLTARTAMRSVMLTVMKPDTLPWTPIMPVTLPPSRTGTLDAPTQRAVMPHIVNALCTAEMTAESRTLLTGIRSDGFLRGDGGHATVLRKW